MTPLASAAFWLEYVIRHRGAPHLKSPAVNMNFLQRHSIDVFAFLFVVGFMIILGLKELATFLKSSWAALKLLIKLWRRKKERESHREKFD